jgi:hypothetical protein
MGCSVLEKRFLKKEEKTMKAVWILIVIVAMAVIGLFFWLNAFRATRPDGSGDVTILPGGDVNGDLVTAGRNVSVQTEVKGDLAVAGANVTVAGPIQGYIMAAGSNVNINGAVGDDLWAAGANVNLNAPVIDNARLAGRTVTLQPQASMGRDAYLAGNVVDVRGRVERDLKVGAAEGLGREADFPVEQLDESPLTETGPERHISH